MLSEKAQKTVDACRFCCMCRHLCPLGLALGRELNNPRAKALLVSLLEKGTIQESTLAQDIYECCLCNACASNCETGYEPAVFVREMRSLLAADGLVPAPIQRVIDALLQDGTLYGQKAEHTLDYLDEDAAAETLLYVGATAAVKEPDTVQAAKSLLGKAGVSVSVFRKNLSSGAAEYDLLGGVDEVRQVAAACAEALNTTGAKQILVLNPSDARMLKQEFPAWGIQLNAEVYTLTAFLDQLLSEGKLHLNTSEGTVTYHDPCRLARDLEETEPARRLIQAMGYTIAEMWQSKTLTRCCGGEVVAAHTPAYIEKTAQCRMQDAVGTGAEMLICACPGCTYNLSKAEGIPVADLYVLLDQHAC